MMAAIEGGGKRVWRGRGGSCGYELAMMILRKSWWIAVLNFVSKPRAWKSRDERLGIDLGERQDV